MFEKWKSRNLQEKDPLKPPLKILVVTASSPDRDALRSIFEKTYWEMLFADGVDEAVDLLGCHPISMVICDRELPGTDWREAIRRLANDRNRVFLASLVADDYLWDEVIRHGGYDIIAKPFREEEVLHAVEFAWAALTKSHLSAPRTR